MGLLCIRQNALDKRFCSRAVYAKVSLDIPNVRQDVALLRQRLRGANATRRGIVAARVVHLS